MQSYGFVHALYGIRFSDGPFAVSVTPGARRSVAAILRRQPAEEHFVAVFDVITDRKRAADALKTSRDLLQSIVDNTDALFYVFDRDMRVLLANRALGELVGLPLPEIIGKRRSEFLPREIAGRDEANDCRVIEAGRPQQFEEAGTFQGRAATFLTTKFPLRDERGDIWAIGGITTDITDASRRRGSCARARSATIRSSKTCWKGSPIAG